LYNRTSKLQHPSQNFLLCRHLLKPLSFTYSFFNAGTLPFVLYWTQICFRNHGLGERCASVRSTGMPILALDSASSEEVDRLIITAVRQALEQDSAEMICFGCAGMAGLDKKLPPRAQMRYDRAGSLS
jgi:hypothetical protein